MRQEEDDDDDDDNLASLPPPEDEKEREGEQTRKKSTPRGEASDEKSGPIKTHLFLTYLSLSFLGEKGKRSLNSKYYIPTYIQYCYELAK